MSQRRVSIENIAAIGEELNDDQLARVAGGLMKSQPPTIDQQCGHYDAPGTGAQSGGAPHDIQL